MLGSRRYLFAALQFLKDNLAAGGGSPNIIRSFLGHDLIFLSLRRQATLLVTAFSAAKSHFLGGGVIHTPRHLG